MKLTKIIVAIVILLVVVLLISTNCKTKENENYDPCYHSLKIYHDITENCKGVPRTYSWNKTCEKDSECGKDGWCNENCPNWPVKPLDISPDKTNISDCNGKSLIKPSRIKPICFKKKDKGWGCSRNAQCKSGDCDNGGFFGGGSHKCK